MRLTSQTKSGPSGLRDRNNSTSISILQLAGTDPAGGGQIIPLSTTHNENPANSCTVNLRPIPQRIQTRKPLSECYTDSPPLSVELRCSIDRWRDRSSSVRRRPTVGHAGLIRSLIELATSNCTGSYPTAIDVSDTHLPSSSSTIFLIPPSSSKEQVLPPSAQFFGSLADSFAKWDSRLVSIVGPSVLV